MKVLRRSERRIIGVLRVQRTLRSSGTSERCEKDGIFSFELREKLRLREKTTVVSSSKLKSQIFVSRFDCDCK